MVSRKKRQKRWRAPARCKVSKKLTKCLRERGREQLPAVTKTTTEIVGNLKKAWRATEAKESRRKGPVQLVSYLSDKGYWTLEREAEVRSEPGGATGQRLFQGQQGPVWGFGKGGQNGDVERVPGSRSTNFGGRVKNGKGT